MNSKLLSSIMAIILVFGGIGAVFANEAVGSGLPEGAEPYDYVTSMYYVSGTVLEVYENGDILMYDENTNEQVVVHIYDDTLYTEGTSPTMIVGNHVVVEYNGIATKSIPMQINALAITYNGQGSVIAPESTIFFGKIIDVMDNAILIENPITGEPAIVNISPETTYVEGDFDDLVIGNYVMVEYSGIALLSYPMQIGAISILYNSPTIPEIDNAYEDSAMMALTRYFGVQDFNMYDVSIEDRGTYHYIMYTMNGEMMYSAKVDTDTYMTYYVEDYTNEYYVGLIMSTEDALEMAYEQLNDTPAGFYSLDLQDTTTIYNTDSDGIYSYLFTFSYMEGDEMMTLFVQVNPYNAEIMTVSGNL